MENDKFLDAVQPPDIIFAVANITDEGPVYPCRLLNGHHWKNLVFQETAELQNLGHRPALAQHQLALGWHQWEPGSEPHKRALLDGCIHRAAGPLLKEECRTLNGCETGKAKISCGYRLPAKYVIHTVGPIAQGEPSETQEAELGNCYKNSLKLTLEHKLRTVAFPCISTGVFGYPNEAAAEVVLHTLRKWLEENKDKVDRLILCVFLEKDDEIYKERLPRFFPVDAFEGLHSRL
ncbi:ADP-ribose glycohydrolase MACROD1 [Tiliqua scincoides]|uniref:ADP-ribose glycohydrolase MACROD1 n=1 Tax=Tiliqua scincoides TaxID=71010 RepID=UPI00346373E3